MKVVFLDIDGVLQPDTQYRFQHDLDQLKQDHILINPEFETIDKYDLGAVVHDWVPNSVQLLTQLLEDTGAKIVISSAWRTGKTVRYLQLLFSVYNLDVYVVGKTPELRYRGDEIAAYLQENPEIDQYVIIDDVAYTLQDRFPHHFVHCERRFIEENFILASEILMKLP